MASKLPITGGLCNSDTDEENLALRKKRSRRVSFADEITFVHIFNRDDDSESPPNSSAAKNPTCDVENEVIGDLVDSNDCKDMSPTVPDDDDEDDEAHKARKSFFQPIESPSPGSSIIGSATSNDEGNFFGPVSASFIKPGRLSDSVALDDNHDLTMDSTAFSMHYQSLARSESGGDFKTLTEVRLASEEKTPSHVSIPSDPESIMVLSKAKKLRSHHPLAVDNASGGKDSNEMSLVGENLRSYDYGKLSPELEALLADGIEDLHAVSISASSNPKSGSQVSMSDEKENGYMGQSDSGDKEMGNVGKVNIFVEGGSVVSMELDASNGVPIATLADQITHDKSSSRNEDLVSNAFVDGQIQTSNQLSKEQTSNQLREVNNDHGDVVAGSSIMDVEFHAISGNTPPNMSTKVLQLDSFAQNESGQQSGMGWMEEHSSKDRRNGYDVDQNSKQQHGSPLAGSISSLSAKQQEIFSSATKAFRQLSYATPSPKQPDSLLRKGNMESGDIILSLHNSSSKFKIFEPSPHGSALRDGIAKSKDKLSKFLSSATYPFNTVVLEKSKDTESKHLDTSILNLEEHLFSINLKNGHSERTTHMDGYGNETPKKIGSLSKSEGSLTLAEDEESLIHTSMHKLSKEKVSLPMTEVASPSRFSLLQKKVSQHILMHKSMEETLVSPASNSSILGSELDHNNDLKTIEAPEKFVSPPVKMLDQNLPSSTESRGSLSYDWNQQVLQYDLVSIVSEQDRNAIGNSHSTAVTDKLESWFAKKTAQSISPLRKINHVEDCCQVERLDDRQIYIPDKQYVSENSEHFQTLPKEKSVLNFHSRIPDRNILIAANRVDSEEELELTGERNNDSSASPSLCVHQSINKPSLKSPFKKKLIPSPTGKELTQSPSKKKPCNASNDDKVQPLVGQAVITLNSSSSTDGNDDSQLGLHNSLGQFPAQDAQNFSRRKRTAKETVIGDADHSDKVRRTKRSPNAHRSQGSDMEIMSEHSNGSDNVKDVVGVDATMKHWSDIAQKFSTDMERLLSSLIDKLNIRRVGLLEDILVHLQKVNLFEMLRSQVQSQEICDPSSKLRHKRVDETKILLYKLVYEKARLQLLSAKREKLLKRVHNLSSAIQVSLLLKSNNIWHQYLFCERDAQVDNNVCSKHEVSCEKVITMRHEFEAVNSKIKDLTKAFDSCFKAKGEPSCSGTIFLLNDHLKKRTSCRLIRQDLQLWELEDLGSSGGQFNIVLNYQGFIHQRFTINSVPIPIMCISNQLNDTNIMKNLPNMDACSAFSYVLNAETTRKYVGSGSLAQETQITSLLLHNLLDVIEEVQLAQLEMRNLVKTSFHSPSASQLCLELCFVDFNSGGMVTLTLDMTCLSWGAYPSKILPFELQSSIAESHKSLPDSLSAEIKAAIDGLGVGYSRIIKLCQCVSQVVQSISA